MKVKRQDLQDMVEVAINPSIKSTTEKVIILAENFGYTLCEYRSNLNLADERKLRKFYQICKRVADSYSVDELELHFINEMTGKDYTERIETY